MVFFYKLISYIIEPIFSLIKFFKPDPLENYSNFDLTPVDCKIIETPVFYTEDLHQSKSAINDIVMIIDQVLNLKELSKYKEMLSHVEKIIFTPYFSMTREELGARKKVVILSFGQCSYYFDFLISICASVTYMSQSTKKNYQLFDTLKNEVFDDIKALAPSHKQLFASNIAYLTQHAHEDYLKSASGYPLLFLCKTVHRKYWDRIYSEAIDIYSVLLCTRALCKRFDLHFVSIYTQLAEQSFFMKYKKMIEHSFKSIIICDPGLIFCNCLPFHRNKGGATFGLPFTYRYITKPYLMVADLIFYTGVYSEIENIEKGYKKGEKLRQNFLKELIACEDKKGTFELDINKHFGLFLPYMQDDASEDI